MPLVTFNKIRVNSGVISNRNVFLTILEAGKSTIRVLSDSGSVFVWFADGAFFLAVPSHVVETRGSLQSLFSQGTAGAGAEAYSLHKGSAP